MQIFSLILSVIVLILGCIELIGIYLLFKDKYNEQRKNKEFTS